MPSVLRNFRTDRLKTSSSTVPPLSTARPASQRQRESRVGGAARLHEADFTPTRALETDPGGAAGSSLSDTPAGSHLPLATSVPSRHLMQAAVSISERPHAAQNRA